MPSEFSLIEKIHRKIGGPKENLLVGIGDDAAVFIPPKEKIVTTVDCLVEDVHFTLKNFKPEEIGHKAMVVSLSDIAAMGGIPLYALFSLGVSNKTNEKFILKFYEGALKLAKKYKVQIIGGNLTRSPKFFADVTLIGKCKKPILRSGAKPGDLVAISGPLGLGDSKKRSRFLFGLQNLNSAIDISDGLSSELWHLSKASKVKIEIDYPFSKMAWNRGEDYELLVTFHPKELSKLKKNFTVIGRVSSKGKGVFQMKSGRRELVAPKGWNHFEK